MENAIDYANKQYVDVNIFSEKHKEKVKDLSKLPLSCWESSEMLEKQAEIFMKYDVFSKNIIDGIIKNLRKFDDKDLRIKIKDNDSEMLSIVNKFIHCG